MELGIDVLELDEEEARQLMDNLELIQLGIDVLELNHSEAEKLRDNIDLVKKA